MFVENLRPGLYRTITDEVLLIEAIGRLGHKTMIALVRKIEEPLFYPPPNVWEPALPCPLEAVAKIVDYRMDQDEADLYLP